MDNYNAWVISVGTGDGYFPRSSEADTPQKAVETFFDEFSAKNLQEENHSLCYINVDIKDESLDIKVLEEFAIESKENALPEIVVPDGKISEEVKELVKTANETLQELADKQKADIER